MNCEFLMKILLELYFQEGEERDQTRLKGIARGKVVEHPLLFYFVISDNQILCDGQ